MTVSFCGIALGLSAISGAVGDDQVNDALRNWRRGCDVLVSYDVFISCTISGLIKENEDGTFSRRPTPFVVRKFSRQIKSGEKRRYYVGKTEKDWKNAVAVWDGSKMLNLHLDAKHLYIRKWYYGMGGTFADYEDWFRAYQSFGDLIKTISDRPQKSVQRLPNGLLVVETPPASGFNLSPSGLKVWLDPARNFMPVRFEMWDPRGSKTLPEWSRTFQLKEVQPGAWAPVTSRYEAYVSAGPLLGQIAADAELRIDLDRSTFNVPIPEKQFEVAIPIGTEVSDDITKTRYVYGETDTQKNLTELARKGQLAVDELKALGEGVGTTTGASRSWLTRPIVLINAFVVVAVLAIVVYRLYRRAAR